MRYFLKLLFLLWVISPSLFAVGFGRSRNGNLMVEDGCSKLDGQVRSLIEWTSRVENRTCESPTVQQLGGGKCAADISSCVPKMVKDNHATNSEVQGPNCWNTALVMQGLIPGLRETSDTEFEFFIRSPLCRELAEGEDKQPGDIGSIETDIDGGRVRHTHAFIHISDELIYNKVGLAIQSPFALQSYDKMHENYPLELTGECKSDCTLPETFRYLMNYQVYKLLSERYEGFRLPEPEATCNAVNRAPEQARTIVPLLLTEEMLGFSLDDPPKREVGRDDLVFDVDAETGETVTRNVRVTEQVPIDIVAEIIQGCHRFKEKQEFLSQTDSPCQKFCQKPVKKYYRCDKPEDYLSRFNDRSRTFYDDLNRVLKPIDCKLEAYLLTNEGNINTIKNLLADGLNSINQYVTQEVGELDTLSEPEKRSLAMVAMRLDEVGYQVGEQDAVRSQLGEVYQLSKSYLP